MIRVLVVDDHAIVRAGISRILDSEPDIEVIGQTGSGHEAVDMVRRLRPDVVLLDFGLPDIDGLEVTRQVLDTETDAKVLILTMFSSEEYAFRLLRAGAAGYLLKGAPTDDLLAALRKVASGGRQVDPEIADRLLGRIGQRVEESPESVLSDREMQVMIRIASGLTTREVAEDLHLSPSTIETYRARILEKLNLRNTNEIIRFAIRRRLVDVG